MTQFPVALETKSSGDIIRVKATTSVERALTGDKSIEAELRFIEMDYQASLAAARAALASAGTGARRDARAYWLVGKHLADFMDRLEAHGFYLVEPNETPARHLGISGSSVYRAIAFYRRYRDPRSIDLAIPWSIYRDNKESGGAKG
jgi:hypothetical protein